MWRHLGLLLVYGVLCVDAGAWAKTSDRYTLIDPVLIEKVAERRRQVVRMDIPPTFEFGDLFQAIIRVIDDAQFEWTLLKIFPPAARAGLPLGLPRIGFYALIRGEYSLYVTEQYNDTLRTSNRIFRKDIEFFPESAPLGVAITLFDQGSLAPQIRKDNRFGIYAQLAPVFEICGGNARVGLHGAYDADHKLMILLSLDLNI